jgi:hypothetical protein
MLAIALHVAGCATPYEPKTGKDGFGYREIAINSEVYYLEFQGNAFTSIPRATKYWSWRADEICAPKGQVGEEMFADPTTRLARTTASGQEPAFAGLLFSLGDPSTGRSLHSKSGYFHCVDVSEARR